MKKIMTSLVILMTLLTGCVSEVQQPAPKEGLDNNELHRLSMEYYKWCIMNCVPDDLEPITDEQVEGLRKYMEGIVDE